MSNFRGFSRRGALLGLLLLLCQSLFAHDFWLEPSSFHPVPGTTLTVRLWIGEHLRGEPFPRSPNHIKQFTLTSRDRSEPIVGRPGAEPAGFVRIADPGTYIVTYESRSTTIDLEAVKFEKYIREEGLDNIIQLRRQRNETDRPVKEAFSRYAKALLESKDGSPEGYGQRIGMTMEIVPEKNPYELQSGEALPVQILLEGKPLPNVQVSALSALHPQEAVKVRSDQAGRARLTLKEPGIWLIKAVHMMEGSSASAVDYESLWGSLIFELPASD